MSAPVNVTQLTYRYRAGPPVLEAVTFTVAAGERVALVGPNGAGKTTLLLCLSGVLIPPKGTVQISGFDPSLPVDRRRLPTVLGVVFQRAEEQILHSRVDEEVAFGPLNLGLELSDVRERVAGALAAVGMAGRDEAVPFHLSGGEQRRIALAGALAMRPAVLILDEPSAFLDLRGRRALTALLRALPQTLLIASHDLNLVRDVCTRAIVLDGGRIYADRPTDQLLADEKLLELHGIA